MRELLARWWAHRKLHRGQCSGCRRPLPDDTRSLCVECSQWYAENPW